MSNWQKYQEGPFGVQEVIGLPGDRAYWVAVDGGGITTGGSHTRDIAKAHAKALNAAYWKGRNDGHSDTVIRPTPRAQIDESYNDACGALDP